MLSKSKSRMGDCAGVGDAKSQRKAVLMDLPLFSSLSLFQLGIFPFSCPSSRHPNFRLFSSSNQVSPSIFCLPSPLPPCLHIPAQNPHTQYPPLPPKPTQQLGSSLDISENLRPSPKTRVLLQDRTLSYHRILPALFLFTCGPPVCRDRFHF